MYKTHLKVLFLLLLVIEVEIAKTNTNFLVCSDFFKVENSLS